jgi:putative heme-binding domain-containing protein
LKPEELISAVRPLISQPDEALRAAAIALAGAWNLKPLAGDVRRQLEQPSGSSAVTIAAAGVLGQLEGAEAVPLLASLVTSKQPMPERTAALRAIIGLDLPLAARLAAEQIGTLDTEPAMAAWLLPIVGHQHGAKLLAEALEKISLSADTAKLAHRALTGAGQVDSGLMAVINKAIGITGGSSPYSDERVTELADAVRASGDASRGREVFFSKLANCSACHRVGKEGGFIGPDLSAVGSGVPLPLIVEAVLWPNRQVKEGYVATRVITNDGQILTGYKVGETDKELTLRDARSQQILRIARDNVDEIENAGSVMPEGLTAGMTDAELRDLVRFLSELGRPAGSP